MVSTPEAPSRKVNLPCLFSDDVTTGFFRPLFFRLLFTASCGISELFTCVPRSQIGSSSEDMPREWAGTQLLLACTGPWTEPHAPYTESNGQPVGPAAVGVENIQGHPPLRGEPQAWGVGDPVSETKQHTTCHIYSQACNLVDGK